MSGLKIILFRTDQPPVEFDGIWKAVVMIGSDRYEIRQLGVGMHVRIEEHDGGLA
jgi:hypothetical protein